MPTDAEYEAKIRGTTTAQLQEMLEVISRGDALPGWGSGKALEYAILRGFQLEGARVTWPFPVTLEDEVVEQIDGAVYYGGLACLVESKDYGGPINIEPFAKLRNQLLRRPPGTLGMIFARSGYTEPAKVLARHTAPVFVLLWEFSELEFAIAEKQLCAAMLTKYRYAVEKAMPDYNILGGLL